MRKTISLNETRDKDIVKYLDTKSDIGFTEYIKFLIRAEIYGYKLIQENKPKQLEDKEKKVAINNILKGKF